MPFRIRTYRCPTEKMNKTELAWARHLEAEGLHYSYGNIGLRLADNTIYWPDFIVFAPNGDGTMTVEIHEVKGYWKDDARVKWKVADDQNPEFRFVAVGRIGKQKLRRGCVNIGGGWWQETYRPQDNERD